MRISYSLGSLLSINEVIDCAKHLSNYNPDTIWIPETWGMENFAMLSMVATQNKTARVGSSIINIYSRSPALVAMGAVTVDTISNGRVVVGLGTSSIPIVEDFHGYRFSFPATRMREYVEITRLVSSGRRINYDGKFFKLRNFSLLIKPVRKEIPIYLAAINQKMVNLTWEIANGVIFYLRPIYEMKETITKMQSKRKIDVSCQITTCISEDSQKAIDRAKKTIAFYVAVGNIYREFLAKNGFAKETQDIFEEYKKNGLAEIHQFVTDKMIFSLAICGSPNECQKQFRKFQESGLDLPIIQFNPVGETKQSFELLTKTFGEIS